LVLDDREVLKNCGLKPKKSYDHFLDLKDLNIIILDEAKFHILKS